MKIKLLNAKQVGTQLKKLMTKDNHFYWAVAWATETDLAEILLDNKKKIKQLVIGTDFTQTSPKLLRKLKSVKNAHIMYSKGQATFHPKVYCFVDENYVCAIVGSPNFTNGGTKLNDEAAFLIEGTVDDKPLINILESISSWWNDSNQIDDNFLISYELRWEANKKYRKKIEKPLRIYRPTNKATHPKLLTTSWTNFINELKTTAPDSIDSRLAVSQYARHLFESVLSFNQLDTLQRKAIAGTIGKKEIVATDLEGFEWGWFGTMSGAGTFNNRIIENNEQVSIALDCVPSFGEVTEDHYDQFVTEFRLAFSELERQGGVPTASRLLALKRPDYFLCVNSKNRNRIAADFGFTVSNLKFENYWEYIIEPIIQAKWWNSKRPPGSDGKIWDARAAMLDVIYKD